MFRAVASALRSPRTEAQLIVLECKSGRIVLAVDSYSATDDRVLVSSGGGVAQLELTANGAVLQGAPLSVTRATITCATEKPSNAQCCMGETIDDQVFEFEYAESYT